MKFSEGDLTIDYRNPNYCDAQELLGRMNIGNMDMSGEQVNWGFLVIGKAAKHAGFLIEEIKLKDEIKTYDWLLNDPVYSVAVTNFTADILNRVMEFSGEKKTL